MQVIVREAKGGWIVTDGETIGPFSRQRALDLAEGMVIAIRTHTRLDAQLVVEDPSTITPSRVG